MEKNFIELVLATDFDDNDFLDKYYLHINVSYFDHFLNEEEYCNAELIAYVDAINKPDKLELFNSIENKFIFFYKKLYNLSKENVFLYNDDNQIIKINSYDEFNKHILNAMKEKPLCTIVFSSLKLVTLTGFDLTHSFFILKDGISQENEMKEKITNIAYSVGLYII